MRERINKHRGQVCSILPIAAAILVSACLQGCGWISGSSKPPEPRPDRVVDYTVRPGDTLYTIGLRFGVAHTRLASWNDIDQPDLIEPGTVIKIPLRSAQKTPTKATPVRSQKNDHGTGGQIAWPVAGGEIVSTFGPRSGTFHDGIDIAAEEGTRVYAAHDGVVAYADNDLTGYGNVIILKSRASLVSIYAHNRRTFVSVGDIIRRGEIISEVGSTGKASGPHLHFEVRVRDRQGRYVAADPVPLFDVQPSKPLRYRVNESLSPIFARALSWN